MSRPDPLLVEIYYKRSIIKKWSDKQMVISVNLPELNMKEDEIKLLLAIKLLEEGIVSLGKAAEIAGFSEAAFVEILLHKGISPIKYTKLDLKKELQNA